MTADLLPPALDAAYLTAALRRAGVLGDARVAAATVESARPTILSRVMRLRFAYDGDARDAPPTVFVKTGLPERAERGWDGAAHELAFYTQVAAAMRAPLTPRCFAAHGDAATKSWHLVLEDLTDTHRSVSDWPLPPDLPACARIIAARARFHAAWWDDPRLGTSIGTRGDAAGVDDYLRRLAA